jgi:hypothetical protein
MTLSSADLSFLAASAALRFIEDAVSSKDESSVISALELRSA